MKEDKFYQTFYKSNIIQPLKGFCTAVEEGCSLAKAGEKLYLSTTAIFKQIHSLEEKLNTKLFKKSLNRASGSRLELTDEGKIFYEKAKDVIERTDKLFSDYVREKDDRESKTLKLITNTFVLPKTIEYINTFQKTHKDLNLTISLHGTSESINMLLNNEADIFFSSIEDKEKLPLGIKFIEFTRYKPYLVLYKGHPLEKKSSDKITLQDLINNKFVFDDHFISMTSFRKFISDNAIKTAININGYGADTMKILIKNEMSIFVIFDMFLNENDKKNFVIKELTNFFPNGKYGCFVNQNYYKKNITKEFLDFLDLNKEKMFADKLVL